MVRQVAALPKFLDKLRLSQSGRADYAQPLALPQLNIFVIAPLIGTQLLEWLNPRTILNARRSGFNGP